MARTQEKDAVRREETSGSVSAYWGKGGPRKVSIRKNAVPDVAAERFHVMGSVRASRRAGEP